MHFPKTPSSHQSPPPKVPDTVDSRYASRVSLHPVSPLFLPPPPLIPNSKKECVQRILSRSHQVINSVTKECVYRMSMIRDQKSKTKWGIICLPNKGAKFGIGCLIKECRESWLFFVSNKKERRGRLSKTLSLNRVVRSAGKPKAEVILFIKERRRVENVLLGN